MREWNDVIPASDVVFQYHTQFGGDILENRDYYTDEWKPGGLSGPTFQSSATVPFNGSDDPAKPMALVTIPVAWAKGNALPRIGQRPVQLA